MEPSLTSSYKKTLALAYLRVILNEYWSIGKPWARSSTMQRIRSCASFIKVGVANAQMDVALKFSRAHYARFLQWNPPLANPRSATAVPYCPPTVPYKYYGNSSVLITQWNSRHYQTNSLFISKVGTIGLYLAIYARLPRTTELL